MQHKFRTLVFLITFICFLGITRQAGAFSLEGLFDIFKRENVSIQQTPSLDASIVPIPNGDNNKNNVIDGGDTVRFTYKIENPTDKEIAFATLNTKIERDNLHFIHNIQGTMSLSDKNKTITIPNLRVNPGQTTIISFDANINYFTDGEKSIGSEPELLASDKKQLLRSARKELKVKALKGKLPTNVDMKQNKK